MKLSLGVACFRLCGTQPDSNDRFSTWHRISKSRSKFALSKDGGIGSMVHDLEPTTGADLGLQWSQEFKNLSERQ